MRSPRLCHIRTRINTIKSRSWCTITALHRSHCFRSQHNANSRKGHRAQETTMSSLLRIISIVWIKDKLFWNWKDSLCNPHSIMKLWHYFQTHSVTVLTDQPLNNIFRNQESLGRITKWVVELTEYDLVFVRRHAIVSSPSRFHCRMDTFAKFTKHWAKWPSADHLHRCCLGLPRHRSCSYPRVPFRIKD